MNVVRTNTAHQTIEDTLRIIQNVRQVSEKIPILIDTKGPELRTTSLQNEAPFTVSINDRITIKGDPTEVTSKDCIYINYKNFVKETPIGSSLLIDDGEIEFTVESKDENGLVCIVRNEGRIKNKKSVNVPGVYYDLPALTQKDIEYIHFAIDQDVEFIAHSFVRGKEDLFAIEDIIKSRNSQVKIIAKIENQSGVDNIDEILDHCYGVMVARGDLGIEISAEKIPGIQKMLVNKCIERKKPVIIATQLLHSMIKNPRPTRAEVSDIANAVYLETDAIMLSGETAFGDYPLESVETMNRIAIEVEANKEKQSNIRIVSIDNQIAVFLAEAAVKATAELPTKVVVLDTLTGRTARYMSAFRSKNPVHTICYNQRVMRELSLSFGVYPDFFPQRSSTDEFKKDALTFLLKNDLVADDDLVLIVGGSFGPRHGATFLEINKVKHLINGEIPHHEDLFEH